MEKQKQLLNNLNEKASLNELQEYIKKVIEIRGFSNKSVQEEMLLLLEETGELAKAIRKKLPTGTIDKDKIENLVKTLISENQLEAKINFSEHRNSKLKISI